VNPTPLVKQVQALFRLTLEQAAAFLGNLDTATPAGAYAPPSERSWSEAEYERDTAGWDVIGEWHGPA
jgi:hypothetical protein